MQHCGKCGNHNLDQSIFCSHCGNRLNYNCPDCGFSNLPQQEFCGGCGKQVANLVPPPTYTPTGSPEVPAPSVAEPPSTQTTHLEPSAPKVSAATAPKPEPSPASAPGLEEQRFAPYQTLETYALLSVECANWEQLKAESTSLETLESARQRCIRTIEQQVIAAEGRLQVSKTNILFITFKQESSLLDSLRKGIDFALTLLKQDLQVQGIPFKFKAGLDIEKVSARDPLTSTLERSVSKPGTLAVSEAVYQQVQPFYRMDTVGPVPMGNRMLQFYRIISAGTPLPDAQAVLEPAPAAPPKTPETKPPPTSLPQAPVSKAKILEAPQPQPAPLPPPSQAKPQFGEGPPTLPEYAPPILAVHREDRTSNLTYAQAIDALSADLSAFLVQGTSNKGKIIALSAQDGLGKSSIVHMVRGKIDPANDKAIWAGGANYRSFYQNDLPLYYWIEILQNMMSLVFEGQERAQVQAQIEKFMAFIYDGRLPEEEAAFLFDFLSVNPPEPLEPNAYHLNGRIANFFLGFFRYLCQKRPLILVMEDLHYADPASLELLITLLAHGLLEMPVCLIMSHTPDFYASGLFATLLQKGPYKELNIAPLKDDEAERFLNDGPLGGRLSEFPVELVDSILRYAHGLPLYLEESLRLLHLRNVLSLDESTQKFIPSFDYTTEDAFLPDSLPAIIRQRLEHLSDSTRYLLQVASVLGEKFSVNMLMALAQTEEEEFNLALTTLFNHGYLIPDAVNTGRFRHGILWQTVYEDIAPDLKEQVHQLISEALEQDFQRGLTVNPMLVAYHAQHGNLSVRALHFWNLTGIFAGQVGAFTGLNLAMSQALEFLKQQDGPLYGHEMALRIVETLGSLNVQREPELAIVWLEWVIYYRQMTGDTTQLIEPLGALTSAYEYQGDFSQALATLEKTLSLIDATRYPLEAASLQIGKLEHLYALGRYQQARTLMKTAIEPLANPTSEPEFFEAYLQARLIEGQILTAQCDPDTLKHLEQTAEMAHERELTGLSIAVQLAKSHYLLRSGEYEACNREADDLLHTIEQLDDPGWFLAQWGLLAMMYHCELEDWDSAAQLTLTVITKAEEARDYPTLVNAQIYAGYIASKQGKVAEALQTLEQAIQQASDHRLAGAALLGWRFLADFEFSLGNREVAYDLIVKALEVAQKPEILNQYEILQLTLLGARVLLAQGDVKAAGQTLENLWSKAVQSKMRPLIAACASEIGHLYKQMAQDAPADLSKKHLMRSTEFYLKAKGIWLELRHLSNVKRVDAAIPRI